MKYKCLRVCYVNDVLWQEGKIYDLPDSMVKSPKNFVSLEEQIEEKKKEGFICNACGKEFPIKVALAGHMRSHLEKRKVLN